MQTRLMLARKKAKVTSREMAGYLQISAKQYSRKENGHVEFTLNEIFKLAHYFDMRVEDLFLPTNFTSREERRA